MDLFGGWSNRLYPLSSMLTRLTRAGLALVIEAVVMKNKGKGQTIGGSADILARMSEDRLLKLWYDTNERLMGINPTVDYKSYAFYRALHDSVVMAYYSDNMGFTTE